MNIPGNAEHVEAAEQEVGRKRQEAKAKMTPTELARLEVIEECAAKLEAAGVPYQLWAASDDGKEDHGGREGWWCFHKLTYAPRENWDLYTDRQWQAWMSLAPKLLSHQSCHAQVSIVMYSLQSGRPVSVHSRGQSQFIPPPPPEAPTGSPETPHE